MRREIQVVIGDIEETFDGGIHLLAEWYQCQGAPELLKSAQRLRACCLAAVDHAALTVVGESFYQIAPNGVTGTVLLAESHLAIHTWPEFGSVTVDVFVCNRTRDNRAKAHTLYLELRDALEPRKENFSQVVRGAVMAPAAVTAGGMH